MDKYTVDLDKVLNDFEYNELTDQCSYDAKSTPKNDVVNNQNKLENSHSSYSSQNATNSNVKHSISNVFQSLNEYLQTDITPKCEVKYSDTPNNVNVDTIPTKEISLHYPNLSKAYDNSPQVNNENLFTSTDSQFKSTPFGLSNLDDGGGDGNNEQFIPVVQERFEEEEDDNALNTNIETLELKSDKEEPVIVTLNNEKKSDILNGDYKINDLKDNKLIIINNFTKDNKNSQSNEGNKEKFKHVNEISQNQTEMNVESCSKSTIETNTTDETVVNDENYENLVEYLYEATKDMFNLEVTSETDEKNCDIVQKNELKNNSDNEKTVDNLIEKLENFMIQHEKSEDNIHLEADVEPIVDDNSPNKKEEIVVKIGFEEELLNLDDSELNKYLDELEKEYESQQEIEKDHQIKEVCDDSHDTVTVTQEKIEEDPSKKCQESKSENQIVDSTSQENTDVEVTTETNINKKLDNLIARPSDLPLLQKDLDENKRQINLIGDPGSTPYNNVYVTDELPEDSKNKEPDSENSSCTSPTFSNASTDTVSSSSDSTDTAVEDEGKIKQQDENETQQEINESEQSTGNIPITPKSEVSEEVSQNEENAMNNNNEGQEVEDQEEDNARSLEPIQTETAEIDNNRTPANWLGKQAPLWIPDADAMNCMHCDLKFTVIKRRHHCRACGLVLCSKCCNLKYRLEYLDSEARVCTKCHIILVNEGLNSGSDSDMSVDTLHSPLRRNQPNPNNPLEYCSTVPPLQQIQNSLSPPSVLVPVGVLKRTGSNKARHNKSVMFCDGIRPGSDLTNLDSDFNYKENKKRAKQEEKVHSAIKTDTKYPAIDPENKSFIPKSDNLLPPVVTFAKSDIAYTECPNNLATVGQLKKEAMTFAIQKNLCIHLKIINMDCCINKTAWCFSTEGLINVGQDEIVIILEYIEDEESVPKDIFYHINNLYCDAIEGSSVNEMGLSLHNKPNFLDSKNHVGFVFIRPSFQCLQNIIKPKESFLIGILIHRWETPWAKLFPLRLVLRLGAEYRYYPSPIISTRHRDSVFVEIGHTIINLLADFRNYSYSLPQIRGLTIHMEDKNTTIMIPSNRYDLVMKSMNNSSDHILAFAGNFSTQADSHLVCIQDTQSNDNNYSTHAINIHNKPRKVTGASFIVFNGALKSSSGLTAKSSIVEDGLMIQIPPEHMTQIRESLRNMKEYTIKCGCINGATDETVNITWGESDVNFNIGVTSPIDAQVMSGVPSIRVHNGKDYVASSGSRLIRWTEVFIVQDAEESSRNQDPVDISKVSESIAKATCQALVKYLDLLVSNSFYKIGIRTTLHVENVSYSAGGNGVKLPPIYMKSLDNELIPVLHRITSNNLGENIIVLELIFRILNV